MNNNFSGGVWPTMLTPFTGEGLVDYDSLGKIIDWYLGKGVTGLFAVCQSSEMFKLSLEERVSISKFTVEKVAGRVPVITSGHISDSIEDQIREINEITKTGTDAVIMVTNRLAAADESDDVWIENLKTIMYNVPKEQPLGFYECPYPYKRLMTPKTLRFCADSGRFYFLKDTCCDTATIRERIKIAQGSNLKIYNANSATLLETLRCGAAGYSGVMANFHPELYKWVTENYDKKPEEAELICSFLTLASFIESHVYPAIAKKFLVDKGVLSTAVCRTCDCRDLTATNLSEVAQLDKLTLAVKKRLGI